MEENRPIVKFIMGSEDYSCDSVQHKNLRGVPQPPIYRLVSNHRTVTTSTDKEYILDLMFALQQARSARQQLPQLVDEIEPRIILGEDRPIAGKLP